MLFSQWIGFGLGLNYSKSTACLCVCVLPHLCLYAVVSVAEVLYVRCSISLDRREVMLQHSDHLWQLGVSPGKLPNTRQAQKKQMSNNLKKKKSTFDK